MRAQKSAPVASENDLLTSVLHLAKVTGWRTYHARPARTEKGWRTAVSGDGVGFPDLILLRGSRGIAWELKSGRNLPSGAQVDWLASFHAAGFNARIVRPSDWEYIEKELTR